MASRGYCASSLTRFAICGLKNHKVYIPLCAYLLLGKGGRDGHKSIDQDPRR